MRNDFFQINNLSVLHNNKNIIFCKTDFIYSQFDEILKNKNSCVLITGNSDYGITDDIVENAPKYIKHWYCQNAVSNNVIIKPIPIGLENGKPSSRDGHGIAYEERVSQKEKILSNLIDIYYPTEFIYANFNIETNYPYRSTLKNYIRNIEHINWEEPNLELQTLFDRFLQHKMVLCPIGNGIDTHRLWEVLYCNRIPIVLKGLINFKIYELYKKLPIIILNDAEMLQDKNYMTKAYQETINKTYDFSPLTTKYWLNSILKDAP